MASPANRASTDGVRGRSWLIPSNRKLRHLQGITLRNLNLTQSTSRPRGKTIDDEGLPYALKSPAKILALREGKQLGHSRSSTDLRPIHESAIENNETGTSISRSDTGKSKENGSPKTPPRPPFPRLRRRSTMEWANASPQKRQEKLESVTAARMADIFFSVHVVDVAEPVYVSEVVEKTMNPNFRHIDLSACGPGVPRLGSLVVRFWVKSDKMEHWQNLLELSLNLRSLQYIGKGLESFHHPLPQNAVIFHLTDGVYTNFTDLSAEESSDPFAGPPPKAPSKHVLPTSSFDALLRLSKLDDSIQDAITTRDKIAADLESLLQAHKETLAERDHVGEATDHLKTVDYAKATVEKQMEKARKQLSEKRASIDTRRELMTADVEARGTVSKTMENVKPELQALRDRHTHSTRDIANQRRRVCEELQKCYPLTPIPKQPLAFKIRSLHLPNSDNLDAEPPDIVAAALGHVAHILLLLSFYLALPLPYPVTPRSSTSTIEDPISVMKTTSSTTTNYTNGSLRTYPLFSKGVPRFRFEYGVFLLNKDIEILLSSRFGVRVLDIRQTLPNLKYLLYVATAGEGELPARKAGGVRGLLRAGNVVAGSGEGKLGEGRGGSMPDGGRRGSEESASSAISGLLFHEGLGNGKVKGAVESLKRNQVRQDSKLKHGS